MIVKLSGNRDALAGLLFMGLGTFGFAIALGYKFGTTIDMGPGYFPRILSLVLIGFGIVTFARGVRTCVTIEGGWAWLPLLLLSASLVTFGFLLERAGLVPALAALFFISARAGHEFKALEVLVLTAVMSVFAAAVFVWGLKLPYSLFAWNF
ncbi:tripartite tricarboxylate transporter TctB family protein [Bosea sp. TND4EK4]|uniref:tripartite tricarboxylate transporter TctB family protein n=1 Tax=Bosea sp. TND4EK4 TaxID=1907408 RepID=UPI000954C5A8|nr:tripartite tricarboxylate transporter TctB family protein [Bosea sp. TND4EK4]SIR04430.1 Tripartite tricarboxylate transporter TctB family protein [Bosea sp. TND4EK4]